jgi:hypothetical protein
MRNLFAWLFYIPGGIIFGGAMLYSTYLSFIIVFDVLPTWAAYISFIFFPFVYGMAPFYAGFVMSDWTLLLISYLGWIPGAILFAIGSKISGE